MLWLSPVHPWRYSTYTSHLGVKITLGGGSERGCDTLFAPWQGTVRYNWPGYFSDPESGSTTSVKGIWWGKCQWPPIPLAICSSGVGHVVGQCPCPLQHWSQQGTLQWASAEKLLWPDYFWWLSEHIQGREILTEMFNKLYHSTGELWSRDKNSLNTFEKRENNEKYRFRLTLPCLIESKGCSLPGLTLICPLMYAHN